MKFWRMPLPSLLRKRWEGNIRFRHTVALSVVILLIMGIGSAVMIYEKGNSIRKAAEARGLAFSRTFALMGAAAVLDNLFRIQEAMGQYLQDPDILEIDVIDPDNMIVAAKHQERIGTVLGGQDWLAPVKSQTEFIHYTKDSRREPILVIVEPLFDKGKIAAWVRVIFSLEQVRREELQATVRMLLVTLALIAAGILGIQLAQRQVSHVFREIIGQLQGTLATLGAPTRKDSDSILDTARITRALRPDQGELEYLTEVATNTSSLLKSQSEALQALATSLDQKVQERTAELAIARDQALEATRHKSEFLANMSHELRTPLNAVIGFSEVLIEKMFGELNQKQEEYMQDILSSGRHLLALINDILDLSKIEAGRMELELTTFDLPPSLANTFALMRERAIHHGIQLSLDIDKRLGSFTADERKVKQILFNLLSNAIKFTPDGGSVSLKAGPSTGGVEISVSDTGIGILPEHQQKIFEEFYQAGENSARKHEGTGLGLTLTKKFVELHGGKIWVVSEPGRGSTFTFSLPMRASAGKTPVALGATTPIQHEHPLVLVIEDDQAAAKLLSIHLMETGFVVEVAHDGETGFQKARDLRPAIITLDILMPGVDGWDLLGRLKADPKTAWIPVVIVSILDERGKGFALGAAEYLVKPVDREALILAVRRVSRVVPSGLHEATILAVDDDPMMLELLEAVLMPEGFTVLKARDGREGLRLARERRVDLIVLDLLMPDPDGFQVVEELKRLPLTAGIPVVVLTCKTLTPEEKNRLNGRISDLMQKGEFRRSDFVAHLRSLLEVGKS